MITPYVVNDSRRAFQIAVLNDYLRMTFNLNVGHAIISRSINALPKEDRDGIVQAVKDAHVFPPESDPLGHHDLGQVSHGDHEAVWRMEYYDRECRNKSEDPADLSKTYRVLRINLLQELQCEEELTSSPTLS